MKEVLLSLHPFLGVLALVATVWLVVEVVNLSDKNRGRIKSASIWVAALVWGSYLVGGAWYVNFYYADKAVILAGPWPFAHNLVMETKEHVFFILLLLASYLPIAVRQGGVILEQKATRTLIGTVAVLIGLLILFMEGTGAIIGLGAKLGFAGGK